MATYEYMAVMRERGTADQWWLVWPGATTYESRPGETTLPTLFTELGKDGWKLTGSEVINSAINPLTPAEWGWSNRVVTENWIFMRELNT